MNEKTEQGDIDGPDLISSGPRIRAQERAEHSVSRRHEEIRLPSGGDGSREFLVSIDYPSLRPTDTSKVDLHIDGCDLALNREQLSTIVALIPTAVGWLFEEKARSWGWVAAE